MENNDSNPGTCARCGARLARFTGGKVCPKCLLADGMEPPGTDEPAEQDRWLGDYELLERIGVGGMGVVYRARQTSLNREVAIKMILAGMWADDAAVRRFLAEAEAAARLRHPNIVTVHEVGAIDGKHFFSMEYVEGRNLAEIVQTTPLEARPAGEYVVTIARAIDHAHEQGILHRDLKPSNILIDVFNTPRVTDFGLAKQLDGDASLTQTGQVLGSPGYMSPEQASGNVRGQGRGSDIYSLGAILYHLVTGRAPFAAASLQETLRQVTQSDPVRPRLINPAIPRDLETICLKCLEKDPSRRYVTASELADDLGRWLRHEPIHARPATVVDQGVKWIRRKPVWAALWMTIGGSVAAFVQVTLMKNAEISRQSRRAMTNEFTATNALTRLQASVQATRAQRYAGDMYFVGRAITEGQIDSALTLLDAQIPTRDENDLRGFEWHYYRRQMEDRSVRVLTGHAGGVTALAFAADGHWLASGDDRGEIRIWDTSRRLSAWHHVETLPSPAASAGSAVRSLAFSPDSSVIAIGRAKGPPTLWKRGPAHTLRTIPVDAEMVAFAGSNLLAIAGGGDIDRGTVGTLTFQNWRGEKLIATIEKGGGVVAAAGRNPILVAGARSGQITVWDQNCEQKGQWKDEKGLNAVALSLDGALVATANAYDRKVRLWDRRKARRITELEGHTARVTGLAFAPNMDQIATASDDGTVRLWDASRVEVADVSVDSIRGPERAFAGMEVGRYYGHANEVWSVVYSPNNSQLASGGRDRTIRVWRSFPPLEYMVSTNVDPPLVLAPAGAVFAACDTNGAVVVSSLAGGGLRRTALAPSGIPLTFSTNSNGVELAVLTRPSSGPVTLRTFELETKREIRQVELAESELLILNSEILATSSRIVARDVAGRFGLWNAMDGRRLTWLTAGGTNTPSENAKPLMAIARDVVLLPAASGFWDLCDLEDGHRLQSIPQGSSPRITSCVLTPDGQTMLTCGDDNAIEVRRLSSHKAPSTLRAPGDALRQLAITPDGRTLAAAARDGRVTLWNLQTLREVGRLERRLVPTDVKALTFSLDGLTLFLAADHQVCAWLAAPRK